MFTPRLRAPAADNRLYIPIADGGLNPCIAKPAGSTLQFANCVFYAWGRFNEIAGTSNLLRSTNAENFCTIAKEYGLTVGQTPKLGAIAVWAKGKVGNGSDGAGHVAVVEEIRSDGSIITSESGWSASKAFWTTHRKNDGNWEQSTAYRFLGFIYRPSDGQTSRALKKGDSGADVLHLQTALADLGYYAGDQDGHFGKQTLGAVLAFQFEHELEADGICGPKTRAALHLA